MTKEFPKDPCRTSKGRLPGYSVEARHTYDDPITVGGQTFGRKWKTVGYVQGPIGVPQKQGSPYLPSTYGLYTYASAQALRWWVHAAAEAGRDGSALSGVCLETRIIEHNIEYDYTVTPVGYSDHVGGDGGDRSSRFPPKRKKKESS